MIHRFPIVGRYMRDVLNEPLQRFRLSLLLLFLLIVIGTGGYILIEGMVFVDALYMTVITLATIGFGEVQPLSTEGRVFTIFFILLGVSTGAWAISNGIEMILGDSVWQSVQRRRIDRALMNLKDHYIVCGYGRMGRQIVRDLRSRNQDFVIIELSPGAEMVLLDAGYPHIIGDAEQDEVLLRAGIERARGLVAALDSDAANVLTVLTARGLNPDLLVVARATNEPAESKLRRAGADRVVSPDAIGGHRLALALLQPKVHDFLEKVFNIHELDIDIGEIYVDEDSALAGLTIAGTNLRSEWNLTILAIENLQGEFIISPDPQRVVEAGEIVIVIGTLDAITGFEQSIREKRASRKG